MKVVRLLAALLLLPLAFPALAAEVRNDRSTMDGNRVRWEYDLDGDAGKEVDVTLSVTVDGKVYSAKDLHLEGDVGKVMPGKGKSIRWNVLQDFPRGFSSKIDWELMAGGVFDSRSNVESTASVKRIGSSVGDFVKPITVGSVDGKMTVSLQQIRRKTLFVIVSSVCTSSRHELEELRENFNKVLEKVDVYVVIVDMDPKAGLARIGDLPFPVLADSNYMIAGASGLLSAPSTLIIEDGQIVMARSGYWSGLWKEFIR